MQIWVQPSDHIQKEIFWYGHYEKEAIELANCLLKETSVVLDIGANIGFFSLMNASKVSKGHIYAFEPVPSLAQHMQKNIELNNLTNISVLPYAVSNKVERSEVFISAINNQGMSGLRPAENFSGQIVSVDTISIDKWINNTSIQNIDLIKIDVEGAEMLVLEGASAAIQHFKPVCLVEIINSQLLGFQNSINDVYQFFYNHHYKAFDILTPSSIKEISEYKEGYHILFLPKDYILPASVEVENFGN